MVYVFDNKIPVLLDSGVIFEVMSLEFVKRLHVHPRPTNRHITVEDVNEKVLFGQVRGCQ